MWKVLRNPNLNISKVLKWDIVWEDRKGFIMFAQSKRKWEAKITAFFLNRICAIPGETRSGVS